MAWNTERESPRLQADTAANDLIVRQHERVSCKLEALAAIDPGDAEQVVLSRLVSTAGRTDSTIGVTIVDVSTGGLGVVAPVYLPRGTRVRVRLPEHRSASGAPCEHLLRVQRCAMIDRSPSYYVGGAFTDSDPGSVGALLTLASAKGAKAC